MPFDLPNFRLQEIIRASKCVRPGKNLEFAESGQSGRTFDVPLDLIGGPFEAIRFTGGAHDLARPQSYYGALIVRGERIRGVDFVPIARRHNYKVRIPAGWHQNVIDPNLPTRDLNRNRHLALPDFTPTDFRAFIQKIADLWNIDLANESTLL